MRLLSNAYLCAITKKPPFWNEKAARRAKKKPPGKTARL
jgi:hypothetical protein